MIRYEHKIRVRYNETDKMGVVYHGNYAIYFETARTEMLRFFGIAYKDMEEWGIMLPVTQISIEYHRSARYDDLLTVEVTLSQIKTARLYFDYRIFDEKRELLTTGKVTLASVDTLTMRPRRLPDYFLECLEIHDQKQEG